MMICLAHGKQTQDIPPDVEPEVLCAVQAQQEKHFCSSRLEVEVGLRMDPRSSHFFAVLYATENPGNSKSLLLNI